MQSNSLQPKPLQPPGSPWDGCDSRSLVSGLRDLRVCLVAGTLGQGGAERQLFYIASALKTAGAKVLVLSLTRGEVWESRLEAIGIPVTFVGLSPSRLWRLLRVVQEVHAFKPDIVQSQHFYTNAPAAIAGGLCRCLSIGAIRNDGLSELRGVGPLLRWCHLNLPHRLAANSRAAIASLESLGCSPARLHHLPNVIDLSVFPTVAPKEQAPFTILGVGRFSRQKRFDRFLRIIAALRRDARVPFRALIAGDGPLRPELEGLARDLGLCPGTVEFLGDVSGIQSLYSRSHLLLLTSDHEGLPNVALEAMACGLPVVATRVGDVSELVQHGVSGYLADAADEEGLLRRLLELVHDCGLRTTMGKEGRRMVETNHSLACLAGNLAALYQRVP